MEKVINIRKIMLEKRRLAARNYEHYIEINFIKTPKAVGKVVYLPIYMAMFLQRERKSNAEEYIPDISALLA